MFHFNYKIAYFLYPGFISGYFLLKIGNCKLKIKIIASKFVVLPYNL